MASAVWKLFSFVECFFFKCPDTIIIYFSQQNYLIQSRILTKSPLLFYLLVIRNKRL